ncbi:MAG: hypothetical protein DWQ49_09955 [Bacteroidetes bacterium]|nr:MAG: hypothetical protein DWQ49_09955 [Bacteroidota bacterium]
MAKGFLELKSYQGNSLRIPGEDASDEDRKEFINKLISKVPNVMVKPDFDNEEQSKEFYRTLGVPESVDGYSVNEDIKLPESRLELLKNVAANANLTKDQFNKVISEVYKADMAEVEKINEQDEADAKALKQKWGHAYDDRYNHVTQLVEGTGAPVRLVEAIKGKLADSETMEWLYNLTKQISGEGINIGNQEDQGSNRGLTPEEAREKIAEINNNTSHPYWIASHPDHKAALEKMIKYQEAARAGR